MARFGSRGRRRAVWLTCLAASLATATLFAKPGTLKTKSGQTYEGDIRESKTDYTVTVKNIDTTVPKSDVLSVDYGPPLDQEVANRLAALDPNDVQGRVDVARYAFDHGRYDLSMKAIDQALALEPNNADALALRDTVRSQQRLEGGKGAATQATDSATPQPVPPIPPNMTGPGGSIPKRLLTPADINQIKEGELKSTDTVRATIPYDVRKKFVVLTAMSPAEFNNMTQSQQLAAILDKGTPEMRAAITIQSDPPALADFKRFVQPMVLNGCATSGCHGGPAGGAFILYNGTDEATTYTNFYILIKHRAPASKASAADNNVFGSPSSHKLVERGAGTLSLLANYGLPPSMTTQPHPPLPPEVYNGIFRSTQDRRYQEVVNWMDHTLKLIEPAYTIQYNPPTADEATTQPTTAPAGSPR